ncbi:MAG: DHH family phosphoesterase [Methanotrichaceae archaeon]|nr:DHH family phosphoesterase [Methanotrichaceae archaeon]
MQISEPEFAAYISRYDNVLFLCHRNADPDAIGSAFALQQAFGGALGAIEDLSKSGQSVAEAIGADVKINPPIEDYEFVVVVDASVHLQLGNVKLARYALVDHHLDTALSKEAEFYIQRPANSTAEIIWNILKELKSKINEEMALGLLLGIISDTGRFRRASPESLHTAAELLEVGDLIYEDVMGVLFTPIDISLRMAVLKAATRSEIERFGEWLVATTEINAFEGYSAMALVDLGADVAFAASSHNSLCRVSGRAGREAIKNGLNLADIMREVADAYGGEGGGHRGAAALEADGNPSTILEECRKRVAKSLAPRSQS